MNTTARFALIFMLMTAMSARLCRAETDATLKYVTYGDNNKANITTNALDLSFDLTRKTKITITGTLDSISGASRKIPILDGITGATAHNQPERIEQRKEESLGVAQKVGSHTLSASVDNSLEDDYASFSYFVSWMMEFNQRNNAVTLSYTGYNDKLFPFGVAWNDFKIAKNYDFAFTSVLTPSSQMRASVSYALDDGYLSNPYHRININDYYFKERHPVLRDKLAFGLFYNLGFEGERISSIQLDYRYYTDSWQVQSHTVGVKLSQHITDWLSSSVRERYYTQSAAYFFKNPYTQEEKFMTADPKLGPFTSFLSGIGFIFDISRGISVELMYEQYDQRTDINYLYMYNSVAKSDLASQILFMSTTVKF